MGKFLEIKDLVLHLGSILPSRQLPIEIISRRDFVYTSTFPVEIVTIKTVDGKNLELFCKYLAGMGPNNFGHRRGVQYEAKIYQHILSKCSVSSVRFYGQCNLPEHNETIMFIEFIGDHFKIYHSEDPEVMIKAAEWLANFHSDTELMYNEFITKYDINYYLIWPRRFRQQSAHLHEKHPWLIGIIEFFEKHVHYLADGKQSIIHGEFYPDNILLKEGKIYPIDWESAAKAAGEIDLASLIEGYEGDFEQKLISAYKKMRWKDGKEPEKHFELRLLLARIYFLFWNFEKVSRNSDVTSTNDFNLLHSLWNQAQQVKV